MGIGTEIFVDSTGGPSTSLYVVKTVKTALKDYKSLLVSKVKVALATV